jgi:hypothetical protein
LAVSWLVCFLCCDGTVVQFQADFAEKLTFFSCVALDYRKKVRFMVVTRRQMNEWNLK